jgi:hypothetical protein
MITETPENAIIGMKVKPAASIVGVNFPTPLVQGEDELPAIIVRLYCSTIMTACIEKFSRYRSPPNIRYSMAARCAIFVT